MDGDTHLPSRYCGVDCRRLLAVRYQSGGYGGMAGDEPGMRIWRKLVEFVEEIYRGLGDVA